MQDAKTVQASHTLQSAMISRKLEAFGHRSEPGTSMETIPSLEWETLILDIPTAYRRLARIAKDEPWAEIRVESADIQKLASSSISLSSAAMPRTGHATSIRMLTNHPRCRTRMRLERPPPVLQPKLRGLLRHP
jgi:hypothetical protein